MFKIAQKCKKMVAYLLLFSFMNILTFLPGSNIEAKENTQTVSLFSVPEGDELSRSTVLELLLENVAGLEDSLPESEKPDFSYDYFSGKMRCFNTFSLDIAAPSIQEDFSFLLIADTHPVPATDQPEELLLHHHNFIFRLTPF